MLRLDALNPQQRKAVETIHGPVLILAGAGTGKTRVITTRIAYLIDHGVPPEHILAVTFTNKAAREMLARVNALMPRPKRREAGESAPRPTVSTFHSFCARLLRQHIDRLGYKRNFAIYNEPEQLGLVKRLLSQLSTGGESVDPGEVLALVSKLKNQQRPNPASSAVTKWGDLAGHLRDRYDSALRACNAVDFDDLLVLALRLFHEHPQVLEDCRDQYRFVMVDEYQDTNALQFQLVHALTAQHRNLCVVGDDDQSIYAWRGAEVANLLDMEQYFAEVTVIKLEQNYRSTNTILNAANALIRHNARRRAKRLWSQQGQGEKITLSTFKDEEEEARTVVEQIEFARLAHRRPWSDHAILFRTNIQARPLETALRKAGVRYHLVGGQSFFDRREVRDFLAYLRVFLNPHDDNSLLRIANVPARGLSDATMQRLLAASQERHGSVFSVMKNPVVMATFPSKAQEAIQAFVELLDEAHRWVNQRQASPEGLVLRLWAEDFLRQSGYLEEIRRLEKDQETADNRISNLKELAVALGASGSPTLVPADRLQDFLEETSLDQERQSEKEAVEDAVTLITMHSCKGLEFPRVFLVGLEQGLLPHSRSLEEGTLDEERRLFYVAITRARQSLALSHCTGRKKYGQLQPCHPSQFLRELPPELLEHANERAAQPVSRQTGKDYFAVMRAALGD